MQGPGTQLAPHSDPLLQGLLNHLASTGPQPTLLALTDAVLALGPHFSHCAGALVDMAGQGIWYWDRGLLEQYGPWPKLTGRRRL